MDARDIHYSAVPHLISHITLHRYQQHKLLSPKRNYREDSNENEKVLVADDRNCDDEATGISFGIDSQSRDASFFGLSRISEIDARVNVVAKSIQLRRFGMDGPSVNFCGANFWDSPFPDSVF